MNYRFSRPICLFFVFVFVHVCVSGKRSPADSLLGTTPLVRPVFVPNYGQIVWVEKPEKEELPAKPQPNLAAAPPVVAPPPQQPEPAVSTAVNLSASVAPSVKAAPAAPSKAEPEIQFTLHLPNASVFFSPGLVSYVFTERAKTNFDEYPANQKGLSPIVKQRRVDMVWQNANPAARWTGGEETEFKIFDRRLGDPVLPTYHRIVCREVYPNIDLVFKIDKFDLKYDWVVRPGGDPDQIQWLYDGAESAGLNADGALELKADPGSLTEEKPFSFVVDTETEEKETVFSRYTEKNGVFGLEVNEYDGDQTLVIDPYIRVWSTYYGSTDEEGFTAVAADDEGNVYAAGYAAGEQFPTFTGVFQPLFGGGTADGVLVKFSPQGKRLWATYFGGEKDDQITGVAIDGKGQINITGYTESKKLPVTDKAFRKELIGEIDVFLAQFQPNGKLNWATYFGGKATEQAHGIAVDNRDHLIICGTTISPDFPKTGPYAREKAKGLSDAFAVKWSNDGRPVWSTCFGGKDDEEGSAIAVDSKDEIYLVGRTKSVDLPIGKKAFQEKYGKGGALGADGYIMKMAANGRISWSTYYGGSDDDEALGVAVDAEDHAIVCGYTTSKDFPIADGAQTAKFQGMTDAFLLRFSPKGDRDYATFIGGDDRDYAFGVTTDPLGYAYVTGRTASGNFPITGSFFKPSYGGGQDAYVARFNDKGKLNWSIYYGGSVDDEAGAVCVDRQIDVVIAGRTFSGNMITDEGSHQKAFGGKIDGFVLKVAREVCSKMKIEVLAESPNCKDPKTGKLTIKPSGGTPPYRIKWENGETGETLANVATGYYRFFVADSNECIRIGRAFVPEPGEMLAEFAAKAPSCSDAADGSLGVMVKGSRTPYQFLWNGGQTTAAISGLKGGVYEVKISDAGGCVSTQKFELKAPEPLSAVVELIQPACFGEADGSALVKTQGGTPPFQYRYTEGTGTYELNQTNSRSFPTNLPQLKAGAYRILIQDANGCKFNYAFTLKEPEPLRLELSPRHPSCNGDDDGAIFAHLKGGTPPYEYHWSNEYKGFELKNLPEGEYSLRITDSLRCSVSQSVTLKRPPMPVLKLDYKIVGCNWAGGKPANVSLAIESGTPPFVVKWSTGDTTRNLKGVGEGVYKVSVTDKNGCQVSDSLRVQKPKPLVVTVEKKDPDCNTGKGGALVCQVTGGLSPYAYKWSNGATKSALEDQLAGKFSVLVTDAAGCTQVAEAVLVRPKPFTLRLTPKHLSCDSENDGAAILKIEGGYLPFTFIWSDGQKTGDAVNLKAGKYSVMVTDSLGCQAKAEVEILRPNALTLKASSRNASCSKTNDGMASVDILTGTPPFDILWSNGKKTKTITDLPPGVYTATVTDANRCLVSQTVSVNPVPHPYIEVKGEKKLCVGQSVELDAGAGYAFYRWNNGGKTRSIKPEKSGTYTVEVGLSTGCQMKSDPVVVEFLPVPETPVVARAGDTLKTAKRENALYEWLLGETVVQKSPNPNYLPAKPGAYRVRITNAEGCTAQSETLDFMPSRLVPEVKVYPNPNQGAFFLDVEDFYLDVEVKIFDRNNAVVFEAKGSGYRKWVELKDQPKGLYQMVVKTPKGQMEGRIVIR